MSTAEWTVYPHGPLESLSSDLYQVAGSMPRNPLPRNMLVWRSPSHGLVVHSPVCLDAAGMDALAALGEIGFILVPSHWHRFDAARYAERFPEAKVLAPSFAAEAVQELSRVDGDFESQLPALDIEVISPPGLNALETHLLIPLADGGRALVITDALFNLGAAPPKGFGGWMLRLFGSVREFGMTPYGKKKALKDENAFRAYLNALAEDDRIRIISVAHGPALRGDLKTDLKGAAQRL